MLTQHDRAVEEGDDRGQTTNTATIVSKGTTKGDTACVITPKA